MSVPSRFGASTASPRTCAAVLRAVASRFGVQPAPVDDVALAAAGVAVEVWCALHRATGLTDPARFGAAATDALAAAVRLSAAGVAPAEHQPLGAPAAPERFAEPLDRCQDWVTRWFPADPTSVRAVAVLAAACLAAGGDVQHRGVADLLILAADDWSDAVSGAG